MRQHEDPSERSCVYINLHNFALETSNVSQLYGADEASRFACYSEDLLRSLRPLRDA